MDTFNQYKEEKAPDNFVERPHKKFTTSGARERIPALVQTVIWIAIEQMNIEKDCLQVFKLHKETLKGRVCQVICHEQERPEFKQSLVVSCPEALSKEKIFVMEEIDDEGFPVWIMLLAEEY